MLLNKLLEWRARVTLWVVCGLLLSGQALAAHQVTMHQDAKGWKMKVDGKDFFVKGVVWGYTPRDENYTYNLWGQPEEFVKTVLDYEFGLMKEAGINAIRSFATIPPKWVQYAYEKYGIMTAINPLMGRYGATINGQWIENTDYSDSETRRVLKQQIIDTVNTYKDVPGVLMYALGNESNYGLSWSSFEIENLPEGEQHAAKAEHLYSLFAEAINAGKAIDSTKPFTIVNGDIQYIDLIRKHGKNWDLLGVNAYRGSSFTSMWEDTKAKYGKPILFFEFGADAFNSRIFQEDEKSQAEYLKAQWEEMYRKAYGNGEEGNALGGFVFEWRDEWWKYKQTEYLDEHNTNASWGNGGYKYDYVEGENNMNEEWWGIMRLGKPNADGVFVAEKRLAYDVLKEVWRAEPYGNKNARGKMLSAIDMGALAKYRAENAERSDSLGGDESFKMTAARIRAEVINRGEGYKTGKDGFDGTDTEYGLMGFADFQYQPNADFRANFTLNLIADAADSDFEYRYGDRIIDEDDPNFELYSFEASYSHKYYDLNAFYHVPRYHWMYKGDFFGLLRETTDMDGPNGQDIWNAKAPYGLEFIGKGALDGLTIVGGPEIYWGANPKAIVKYDFGHNKQYTFMHSHEFGRNVDSNAGGATAATEISQTTLQGKFDLGGGTKLQIGGIVSSTEKEGDKFDFYEDGKIKQGEIELKDTLGLKAKLEFNVSNNAKAYVTGQYAGLVADAGDPLKEFGTELPYSGLGNKMVAEAGVQITHGDWMFFPRVFARDNLLNANPNIATTLNNTGAIVGIDSRNTEVDPFAVLGNRQVRAAEMYVTFDPTPETPFYAWDNDVRENASFAFNAGFTYMDYQKSTDAHLFFYEPKNGDPGFNAPFAGGLEPDELWLFKSKMVFNPVPGTKGIVNLEAGKSQPSGKPDSAVEYYGINGKLILSQRHILSLGFKKDGWGPYDYQREFDLRYPEQYTLGYTYLLDKGLREKQSSKVGFKFFYRTLDKDSNSEFYENEDEQYTNNDQYELQVFLQYNI